MKVIHYKELDPDNLHNIMYNGTKVRKKIEILHNLIESKYPNLIPGNSNYFYLVGVPKKELKYLYIEFAKIDISNND